MSESSDTGAKAPCRAEPAESLGELFVATIQKDFQKHGADALDRVRESDPKTYLATVGRMVPTPAERGDRTLVLVNIDLRGNHG